MAGSSVIGALRVQLGLDSAQFVSGASAAEKRAEQLGFRIGKALRSPVDAALSLKGALAGVGIAATATAFAAATQRALDYADAISDLSDRTGASAKLIQEFRYAAQLSGSSVEVADEALGKFTRSLGLAQAGSKLQIALFAQLGVTSRDFETAFRQTLDGLAKLPTVQQRNAAALQLFGRSAASLTGLMGQGTEGFDRLAAAARNLGVVIDGDVLRSAGEANDKLDQLKMILNAQFANVIAQNAQSIVALANALSGVAAKVTEFVSAVQGARRLAQDGEWRKALFGDVSLQRMVSTPKGYTRYRLEEMRDTREKLTAAKRRYDATKDPAVGRGVIRLSNKLKEQAAMTRAAASELRAATPTPMGSSAVTPGSLPTAPGSGGKKGGGGKSGESIAREKQRAAEDALRNEQRYQADLARAENDVIDARADLAVGTAQRAELETQSLMKRKQADLEAIRIDADLTTAQKARLTALVEDTYALRAQLADRRTREALEREALDRQRAASDNEQDILQAQAGLARTSKERRRLELELLKAQFRQLRLAQEATIASAESTEAEKEIARARLATLDKLEMLATERTRRDTQGPLERYLDGLPRSADEMNEAMEGVAADGIASVVDGLADAATGARTLGDVFEDVANDIVRQLAKIAIQKAIVGIFGNLLGGATGGLDVGGSSAGGGSIFDRIFTKPKGPSIDMFRAKGGSVIGGRDYFVGERGVELFTPTSSGRIIANDDLPTGGRTTVHQNISFSGAVDLATRSEVYRVADAARAAAIQGVREADRRRG